jgi:hypothetical protein
VRTPSHSRGIGTENEAIHANVRFTPDSGHSTIHSITSSARSIRRVRSKDQVDISSEEEAI